MKRALAVIFTILVADQWLKVWVKLTMSYGTEMALIGDWCKLRFIENPGMAFGLAWGGETGKLLLTLFRIVAVIGIAWYLRTLVREQRHKGLILCMALIFAGAMGNIIDSTFYGLIWNEGATLMPSGDVKEYRGVAQLSTEGYAPFLHGSVVDMFYFPIIENAQWPAWVPFVGSKTFTFFSAIFNIADAAISVGVICLILFQRRFYPRKNVAAYDTAISGGEGPGSTSVEAPLPERETTA